MPEERTHDVPTSDGRNLSATEFGAPDAPLAVVHHGTPGSGAVLRSEGESAERLGLRLLVYDRPGYAGSTRHEGRTVADAAADVAAILDHLGVERFVTYGVSGGGPHALACAALLPDRCAAAASVAGIGPADQPDLDWFAGMGEGNIAEMGAAREGPEALTKNLAEQAEGILAVGPEQLADALRPHLSEVDARALTGELAEFLLASVTKGLEPGIDGWFDDDIAFLAPWGFDLSEIRVPVAIWQGEQDHMVPPGHGRWLSGHVAGADARIYPEEGHITLTVNRMSDVHAWVLDHLRA
ncbi:MAG TPA: alpha/beta fold hydrolase [Thermoleophilaceae bacterium]